MSISVVEGPTMAPNVSRRNHCAEWVARRMTAGYHKWYERLVGYWIGDDVEE